MVDYKYCPQCAQKLTLREYPYCPNCNLTIYNKAPHPSVGILPIKDGKVLLAIRGRAPNKGSLDIIGGFIEGQEHPLVAVEREALEETGAVIKPTELLGIYTDRYGSDGEYIVAIHYIGKIISGEPVPMDDVAELKWLDIATLKPTAAFKSANQTIEDLKKWFSKQPK